MTAPSCGLCPQADADGAQPIKKRQFFPALAEHGPVGRRLAPDRLAHRGPESAVGVKSADKAFIKDFAAFVSGRYVTLAPAVRRLSDRSAFDRASQQAANGKPCFCAPFSSGPDAHPFFIRRHRCAGARKFCDAPHDDVTPVFTKKAFPVNESSRRKL